jgi:hypothetical protein
MCDGFVRKTQTLKKGGDMYDIIPDIHGQAEKLRARLTALGYKDTKGSWRHSDRDRTVVFLGDFIDRGPRNGEVIDIVRGMIDAGDARAVMGNHELNAIRYHTRHRATGKPLREHSRKNTLQHRTFLDEFPDGDRKDDVIAWMKTLPLFLEIDGFRAVHACWDEVLMSQLRGVVEDGVLDEDLHVAVTDNRHPLHKAVETTTKGPEYPLPDGSFFRDKDGTPRDYIRVKWWARDPDTWNDIAMSVPNPDELPSGRPPEGILQRSYASEAPPVFFGHYWLTGEPALQAENVLCLDYSAGKEEGPLVSYLYEPEESALSVDNVSGFGGLLRQLAT